MKEIIIRMKPQQLTYQELQTKIVREVLSLPYLSPGKRRQAIKKIKNKYSQKIESKKILISK